MTGNSANRTTGRKAEAIVAGLGHEFTGHGGRVGMAQNLAKRGAKCKEVQVTDK